MSRYTFTSESVSEGHPDKVCDYISDSILDACLEQDKQSRVACETLCKSDTVVVAGEISTNAKLDYDRIVRQAVKEIGYTDPSEPFCDTTLKLISLITNSAAACSSPVPNVSTFTDTGFAMPMAYSTWISAFFANPPATTCFAT